MSQVKPVCRPLIDALIDQLLQQAEQLGVQPVATLHGDLHLKNFLVASNQVALIDLDNVCIGSPWQELGSFAASLYYRSLLGEWPLALTERMIQHFHQAYVHNVNWSLPEPMIRWYTATALLNERAYRTVTRMKSGGFAVLDDLLRLAAQIVVGERVIANRKDMFYATKADTVSTVINDLSRPARSKRME